MNNCKTEDKCGILMLENFLYGSGTLKKEIRKSLFGVAEQDNTDQKSQGMTEDFS